LSVTSAGVVTPTGNLLFSPDATHSIGLTASFRPAAVYTGILSVYNRIQTETNSLVILGPGGGTGFARINLGGSTSSFPAVKRNATAVNIRLADDSADAPLTCSNFTASGTLGVTGDVTLSKTITAAATTGAQTINKTSGSVNFAAAATSLVVTNSLVTANSVIICTVGTNDTTLKSVSAVAAAGSFTLHANAAATAETRVNFIITN
jgi:hypothetical protein